MKMVVSACSKHSGSEVMLL